MDYRAAWSKLEEAYARCDNAESFLLEILRIWAEHGLLEGEWSCSLSKVG
ncbi:MAG: hypothetical protein HPY75_13135 [Actinobacteria bacterium]|nr:hypothetical protein [Actinomycetota bacterium]